MASWLQRQRKDDLKDLADDAGFKGASGMTKQDLVPALDQYLRQNTTTLSSQTKYQEYYESAARSASPIKKEADGLSKAVASTTDDALKAANKAKRRVTKAAEEILSTTQSATATVIPADGTVPATSTRSHVTPRVSSARARSIASTPRAAIAAVERRATTFYEKNLEDYVDSVQESLSTVYAIHVAALAIEGLGLLSIVLPTGLDFRLATFSVKAHSEFAAPDLNKALSGEFWLPVALWLVTSLFLPLLAGFLVNLTMVTGVTRKLQRTVDPVAFNVAKALITWLVYDAANLPFYGNLESPSVLSVKNAGFGLYGLYTSAAVCALSGLYDAILRR